MVAELQVLLVRLTLPQLLQLLQLQLQLSTETPLVYFTIGKRATTKRLQVGHVSDTMDFRVVLAVDLITKEVLTTTQLPRQHLLHNIIKNPQNRKPRLEGRRLLHHSQR
jgi:hypothetical protein